MRFRGRAHELEIQQGYRCGWSTCKCGWSGSKRETMDEIFLDYRRHIKRIDENLRRT